MHTFTSRITAGTVSTIGRLLIILSLFVVMLPKTALSQAPLRLVIQPIQSEQKTREIFQPLADYMTHLTGQQVELITYPNYISYWSETQKPDSYDIAFDAAHFIDYRDKNMDFTVLAKQPGIISISLIVPEDDLVFDPEGQSGDATNRDLVENWGELKARYGSVRQSSRPEFLSPCVRKIIARSLIDLKRCCRAEPKPSA